MIVKESLSRDILRLFVWFPLRWTILIIPVRWGILVLRTMGDIHFCFSRGKKRILEENFFRITNEKNYLAIREYFRNYYIDRFMIFIFPRLDVKRLRKIVEISGIENLDAALKMGKGVLLVHGHFGPVHLPLVALARLGYRMKQIGLPSDEGLSWIGRNVAFRLRMKYEARIPAEIIKADSFLRGAFRWLSSNGIIMITGDGSGTKNQVGRHEVFEFLGNQVMLPIGPSILAEKTGAALLPMFIVPGEKTHYKIILEASLTSDLCGMEKTIDITRQFLKRLETYISKFPGYMHFIDRFAPGMLIVKEVA